jgi:hypothetical protein
MKGRPGLEFRTGQDLEKDTWTRRVNRMMADEGGQLLQHKMLEGRTQWWVTRGDGQTVVAGETVKAIAEELGINGGTMGEVNYSSWIDARKAAKISGFSVWMVRQAANRGEIMFKKLSAHTVLFEPESVRRWASTTESVPQAKGSQRRPRRKPSVARVHSGNGLERLDSYLARWQGTPFEMSRNEFIEKAVEAALNKLDR